jgi:hypothetical protein
MRVIRSKPASELRAPLARRCDRCLGRRVIVIYDALEPSRDRIVRCPVCNKTDPTPGAAKRAEAAPLDLIARAA